MPASWNSTQARHRLGMSDRAAGFLDDGRCLVAHLASQGVCGSRLSPSVAAVRDENVTQEIPAQREKDIPVPSRSYLAFPMATVTLELDEALTVSLRKVLPEVLAEHRQASEQRARWLDVAGAADYLSTTPAALRALVKRGQLVPHRTPHGRVLFRPEELDDWVRGEAP